MKVIICLFFLFLFSGFSKGVDETNDHYEEVIPVNEDEDADMVVEDDDDETDPPAVSPRLFLFKQALLQQMMEDYEKKKQAEKDENQRLFDEFKSEWEKYRPALYPPPPSYLSYSALSGGGGQCPPCNCNPSRLPPPVAPGARSLPLLHPDDEDDEDYEDDEDMEDELPPLPTPPPIRYPNRYLRPIKIKSRSRRSTGYNPYWYKNGSPNRALTALNLGYRAKAIYSQAAPSLVRPLHFGTIRSGRSRVGQKYRRQEADFNFPEDYSAFNRRPRRTYY